MALEFSISLEVKAMSCEEAKQRAIRVLNIKEEQIINVVEKVKSKSHKTSYKKKMKKKY